MLLSQNPSPADDVLLHTLRSLLIRGRHAEADRAAKSQKRRLEGEQGRLFLALRAEIALGLGRFAAALDWVSEALRGLDACHGLNRALVASRIQALIGLGRFRDAKAAIETTYARLDSGPQLNLFRGYYALHSGRLSEAARFAADACALAVSSRQRAQFVEALQLKARVAREMGDVSSASVDLDRAQGASNGLRDVGVLAAVLSDRADLLAHSGRWREATRDADRSGRLFARAFSPHEHLSAGRRTGLLGLAQGDPNEALPAIERAAGIARRGFGTTECRAEIDLLLADAQLAGRDPLGALERATSALAFYRHAQDPGGLARAHVRRSLAALSASNPALAFREARIAGAIENAGPVAEGLADLALGRVLLRKDPSAALAPFRRAASNGSLYPPLLSVAELGLALASGTSPRGDQVKRSLARIEAFGDRRILAIVRSDLRDLFGIEPASPSGHGASVDRLQEVEPPDTLESEPAREFLPGLFGSSPAVLELGRLVGRAAPSELPVSIYGETGVGKENVARAIHAFSPRAARKCVPINGASLTDELFESQLFGHVRGSFTGAHTDRPGLVEEAKGGTLFIDEVADLSDRSQIRLLRFLQEGTYRKVGENHERRADVRIVVAANQPLEDLAAAGRFRKDLLYRLQGICLIVPPLRERGRDIVRLARHFVDRASGGKARLSPQAEAEISAHSWPGNVRELEQEMKRAVILADADRIDWMRPKSATVTAAPGASPHLSLQAALCGFERTLVKSVLESCAEKVEAARRLGISRQALHQKIVRYGLG